MARFIARRLSGMLARLFAISVIVFVIFNVIPGGDPAQRMGGREATPELVAQSTRTGVSTIRCPSNTWTMKKIFTGDLISYPD